MSDGPKKKKFVIKKKGGKSPIKLNQPSPETEALEDEASPAPAAESVDDKVAPDAVTSEETAPPSESGKAQEDASPFKFYCVYCGQKLSASRSIVGATITCPSCKRKIVVPTPPEPTAG